VSNLKKIMGEMHRESLAAHILGMEPKFQSKFLKFHSNFTHNFRQSVANIKKIMGEIQRESPAALILVMELPQFGPRVNRWTSGALVEANAAIGRLNVAIKAMVQKAKSVQVIMIIIINMPVQQHSFTRGL
jgi:hypothetical protein